MVNCRYKWILIFFWDIYEYLFVNLVILFKDDILLGYSKENLFLVEMVVILILSVLIWLFIGIDMFLFGIELVGNIKCVIKILEDGKVFFNKK